MPTQHCQLVSCVCFARRDREPRKQIQRSRDRLSSWGLGRRLSLQSRTPTLHPKPRTLIPHSPTPRSHIWRVLPPVWWCSAVGLILFSVFFFVAGTEKSNASVSSHASLGCCCPHKSHPTHTRARCETFSYKYVTHPTSRRFLSLHPITAKNN